MQLGVSETTKSYMCSDGFIIRNMFVLDFGERYQVDFLSCLFLVVPPNHYEVQQVVQKKIKSLEMVGIRGLEMAMEGADSTNLVQELEYEISEGVDSFYSARGAPITYGQYFQLLHLKSSKFLSYICTSFDGNFAEGYS